MHSRELGGKDTTPHTAHKKNAGILIIVQVTDNSLHVKIHFPLSQMIFQMVLQLFHRLWKERALVALEGRLLCVPISLEFWFRQPKVAVLSYMLDHLVRRDEEWGREGVVVGGITHCLGAKVIRDDV